MSIFIIICLNTDKKRAKKNYILRRRREYKATRLGEHPFHGGTSI
jgi:hypothetical protein